MQDALQGMLVFAAVARTGSFTAAAEALGVTRSAVSKQVAHLEASLGVRLLSRTTRSIAVTDVGTRVLACCERISVDVERAYEVAQAARHEVAGRVRLTAPVALGRRYVVPLADQLLRAHPSLQIELNLTDAYADLVRERIDLALRVGRPSGATLAMRKLARAQMVLCAAPSYVERAEPLERPAQLERHPCILHGDLGARVEVLRRGRERVEVSLHGRLSCVDGPAAIDAATLGGGVLMVPEFEVADELRSGKLVRLLPAWQGRTMEIFTVLPSRKHVPTRVRTVESFLREQLSGEPWSVS